MKYAAMSGDVVRAVFDDPSPGDVAALGLTLIPQQGDPGPFPGAGHVLKIVGGALHWVDVRSLNDYKAAKNAEINAARLQANRTTFTFSGKQIACDELSRSDIDGAHGIILMTSALPPGWPGGWKTVENDFVPITSVQEWAAFFGAMVAQGTANFAKAQALKQQLASATTVGDVEAIKW